MLNRDRLWLGMAIASVTSLTACNPDTAAPPPTEGVENLRTISRPIQLNEPEQITELELESRTEPTAAPEPQSPGQGVNVVRIEDDESTNQSADQNETRESETNQQRADREDDEDEVEPGQSHPDLDDHDQDRQDADITVDCEMTFEICSHAVEGGQEDMAACESELDSCLAQEETVTDDGEAGLDACEATLTDCLASAETPADRTEESAEADACFEAHRVCKESVVAEITSHPLMADPVEPEGIVLCEAALDACLGLEDEDHEPGPFAAPEDIELTEPCFEEFDACLGYDEEEEFMDDPDWMCQDQWFVCLDGHEDEGHTVDDVLTAAMAACDFQFDTCIEEAEGLFPNEAYTDAHMDDIESLYLVCDDALDTCLDYGESEEDEFVCFDAHGECMDGIDPMDDPIDLPLEPCDTDLAACVDAEGSDAGACLLEWEECTGLQDQIQDEFTEPSEM